MLRKLNLKLILLFLLFSHFSYSNDLEKGDSLFAEQKYTEALDVYEGLFDQEQFTASMLLRMAFINDGLGNYPKALYFLDLYYQKTADRSVVTKINQISEENNLYGYRYDDSHFFKAVLSKYQFHLQLVLLSLILLLMVYSYRKQTKGESSIPATILQLLIAVTLLIVTNQIFEDKHGIISNDRTLLRSGPSAGAEPIEMVSKGHKVKVLEELPAWTKISWDGEEVYVRKGKVRVI